MNLRLLIRPMRAAALLGSALIATQAASPQFVQNSGPQPAPSVITLDPSSAYESANRPVVRGEASFANPPANFYAFAPVRAGEPASVESIKLRFSAGTTLGSIQSTADFPIQPGGSCVEGQAYAKGDTCIVLVRFTPQGAGRRLGKLTLAHEGSAEPDGIGLGGYGYEPLLSFAPALISTVPGTYPSNKGLVSGAKNLTVDGGDILYIADTGNDAIRQIDSAGTVVNTTPVAAPQSVAVDSFGFIYTISPGSTEYFSYYPPWGGYTFYFGAYTPGTCTVDAPCDVGTVGMGYPGSLTIDPYNDLFLEESTHGAMEAYVGGVVGGGNLPTINAWYLDDGFAPFSGAPTGFGVNANDSVFTAYTYSYTDICFIVEESLYSAEGTDPTYTRVAGGSKCGESGDGGPAAEAEIGAAVGQIAFDAAGDMYFTDTNNQRVRMVNVATGIITTIAGNGTAGYMGDGTGAKGARLSYPTGVAVDSLSQVYILSGTGSVNTGAQVVRKLGPNGYLAFASQAVGTTSAAGLVTVTNTGNATMTLTNKTITGTNSGDFSIDPTTTSCVLTAGATLATGQSCKIGILFKPAAAGTRTAKLTFLDNTVTNSNVVQLSGTAVTPAAAALNPGVVTFPSTAKEHTTTVPVTLTNSGDSELQLAAITIAGANPKMFSYTSNCGDTVAPKTTCTLQVTFTPASTGSYAASLKVTDNAPDSPQSVNLTGSGVATVATSVKIGSSTNPAPACEPVSLSVTVNGPGGGVPTGAVTLKNGATVLATASLEQGAANLPTAKLAEGSNELTASYAGDATHEPSTSAPFMQIVESASCRVAQPITAGGAASR